MENVYISNLQYCYDEFINLPYIYGALRAHAETIPELRENYRWQKPLFEIPPNYGMDVFENLVRGLEAPRVLGLSCYVWNIQKQLLLAKLVKEKHPDCLVVAGGPQVPDPGNEFLARHPYLDLLVHGEGEKIFSSILREKLAASPDWSKVKGVSYRDRENRTRRTENETRIQDFFAESPYLAGYFDELAREIRGRGRKAVAFWETNRGCPYSCAFCNWGSATMSKLRRIPEPRLFQELEWFSRHKIDKLKSTDANFGILELDERLADRLIELHERTGYPKKFWATHAKSSPPRVLSISTKIAASTLCTNGTTVSLQSLNPDSLRAVRRKNLNEADYAEIIRVFNENNFPYYCELIVGLPFETPDTFFAGITRLLELGVHENLSIYACEIFPNTAMDSAEYRARYEIQTVRRRLFKYPLERDPLAETTEIVVSTHAMAHAGWIDCMVMGSLFQIFHCGGWTRQLSIFLRREREVSFARFYADFFAWMRSGKSRLLASCREELQKIYRDILENPEAEFSGWSIMEFEYEGSKRSVRGFPFATLWARLALRKQDVFGEISAFIEELFGLDEELAQVLSFQNDLILTPDYIPEHGKAADYEYDFFSYFYRQRPLRRRKTRVHYRDQAIGPGGIYPLPRDAGKFLQAVTGGDTIRPHCFLHQSRAMEVTYF